MINIKALIIVGLTAGFISNSMIRADVGVALKGGTLGAGADLTFPFIKNINVRGGGNFFAYTFSRTINSVNYKAQLDLASGIGFLDYHPFGNSFRLTGGGVFNGNKLQLTGQPTASTFTVNGNVYSTSQINTLTGHADFESIAPYGGIGFGNAISPGGHWNVAIDLGCVFEGKPRLHYDATGPGASNAGFQADINTEIGKAKKELHYFEYYPLISLGISYRF